MENELIKLLKLAQGERSLNAFARHADVSPGNLSRIMKGQKPTPEVLKKLATKAHNDVTYEQLMAAAGYIDTDLSSNNKGSDKLDVPKEYSDKYKVTSRDKKQYLEHMKKATEAFFMNDEFDEEEKKEILDTMNELFWQAKALNKRKPKDK